MSTSSITILGGDLRQCYAAEYLLQAGWQVTCFHTPDFPWNAEISFADSISQALNASDLILAPTPLSKDGIHLFQTCSDPPCLLTELWDALTPDKTFVVHSLPKETEQKLTQKGCPIFSFSQSPVFSAENALLTGEGLLAELIRYTPFSLSSANVLLLGYGCCGSAIGTLLHPICRSLSLLEQEEWKRSQAESKGICPITWEDFSKVLPTCSLVINTIPKQILEPAQIRLLSDACHIFDIASAPFGFPDDLTEQYLLPYFRLPGLPGRFSPITSGELIGKIIERITDYVL
ncbi:MAG: hypothetical protein HFH41_02540 [Lachnospiraceae bacterium]|nr:hypothetical protein [Lachnospiraceae bacterium]